MKPSKPKVSIIMPVFNTAGYVAQAVESVLQQTVSDWELIIVNDGSTDNSKSVIQKFEDQRIVYLEQTNRGASAARNRGLNEMKGDFFCFLDSDDLLPPQSLEVRLNCFERNPHLSFVDGRVKIYSDDMSTILSVWTPRFSGDPFKKLIRLSADCFYGPTWMIKREPQRRYQFNESLKYCEDWMFYISLSENRTYGFTDETILHYRRHNLSAMRNIAGIAQGYTRMRNILTKDYAKRFTFLDKLIFDFKSRKIIFLSFLAESKPGQALKYLVKGEI